MYTQWVKIATVIFDCGAVFRNDIEETRRKIIWQRS